LISTVKAVYYPPRKLKSLFSLVVEYNYLTNVLPKGNPSESLELCRASEPQNEQEKKPCDDKEMHNIEGCGIK